MYRSFREVSVPYLEYVPNLTTGSEVTISGQMFLDSVSNQFAVSLGRSHAYLELMTDIALHFCPQLDGSGCVVLMNHQGDGGQWGEEEWACGDNLFKPGVDFVLKITVENEFFTVEANGKPFATFKHRLEFGRVNAIEIIGCVKVDSLAICRPAVVMSSDWESQSLCLATHTVTGPKVSYTSTLKNDLKIGSRVLISGSVPSFSPRFEVNFAFGQDTELNNDSYALHFNPRFDTYHRVLILNSKKNDQWGQEVRNYTDLNIGRGREFKLEIVVCKTNYMIYANDRHVSDFHHRLPFKEVGLIDIRGDVRVDKIQFREL